MGKTFKIILLWNQWAISNETGLWYFYKM